MCCPGGGVTERHLITFLLLAGSLGITIISFILGYPLFFLLLFIPFLFSRGKGGKRCPLCGWEAKGSEKFCPYDGAVLGNEL
ncbi:MAG: hypothetical protein D5R96_09570 [Methanocalculus sp. MSAO_Arc2]|nr:MAG: hypothetical protein D5R96_09570 [Methanocalculus sp. MSAO_Arc2]